MEHSEHAIARQISSVLGWLELGNAREALAELEAIPDQYSDIPALLELRWTLHASEHQWPKALATARRMLAVAPEQPHPWLHQAYALRRVQGGGLNAAWDALLPVLDRFPEESTIPYNLACYACQLGRLDEAGRLLARARRLDPDRIKSMALLDSDLEALRGEIERW